MGMIKKLIFLFSPMRGRKVIELTQEEKDAARLEEARKWLASRTTYTEDTPRRSKMTDEMINPNKSHLLHNIHHEN